MTLALRGGELAADEEECGEEGKDGGEDADNERACERSVVGLVDRRIALGTRRAIDKPGFDGSK